MNVNTNMSTGLSAIRQMNNTQQVIYKAAQNISSGSKINNASDDPAGLAILEKLTAQLKGYERAIGNIADASNLINTADAALSGTHDVLQRMRELATQSANGTLSDSDREMLQMEYGQLMEELDDISTKTKFNDKMLFVNAVTGQPGQPNPNNSMSIQTGPNAGDTMNISVTEMVSGLLNLGSTNIGTQSGAKGALAKMNEAINTVSTQRAALGAQQNRLGFKANANAIAAENTARSMSAIGDSDIAKEMMRFTSANIRNNASMAMLAQANSNASSVISLLR